MSRSGFQSSNVVRRGFCADCGTPLTYEAPDGVAVAAGAFMISPSAPWVQYGVEGKLPYVDDLPALPQRRTEEDGAAPPSSPASSPTSIRTTTRRPGRRADRAVDAIMLAFPTRPYSA